MVSTGRGRPVQPAKARTLHGSRLNRIDGLLFALDSLTPGAGQQSVRQAIWLSCPRRAVMKRRSYSDELGLALVRFFQNYLPTLRGMSRHTIHSYRDTLVLLLRFLSAKRHCGIERLDLAAITADSVGQFLTSLER